MSIRTILSEALPGQRITVELKRFFRNNFYEYYRLDPAERVKLIKHHYLVLTDLSTFNSNDLSIYLRRNLAKLSEANTKSGVPLPCHINGTELYFRKSEIDRWLYKVENETLRRRMKKFKKEVCNGK